MTNRRRRGRNAATTLTETKEEICGRLPENLKPENMSIQDQNNCRLGAPPRTDTKVDHGKSGLSERRSGKTWWLTSIVTPPPLRPDSFCWWRMIKCWLVPARRTNRKPSFECVKVRAGWLLRERQTGRRCLEASGVFFWRELQPGGVLRSRKQKQSECTAHSYSTSLICYRLCSGLGLHSPECVHWRGHPETLSPPPPPDLDSQTNKARRVVALDK